MECRNCHRRIGTDWNYCNYCGNVLESGEKGIDLALKLALKMVDMEESRRAALDLKATSYIGLTSIAATIYLAFGGILLEKMRNIILPLLGCPVPIFLILYLLTIISLFASIFYAFRAYHTGVNYPDGANESMGWVQRLQKRLIRAFVGRDIWAGINPEVLDRWESRPWFQFKDELRQHQQAIYGVNYAINNRKCSRISSAYIFMVIAMLFLSFMLLLLVYYIWCLKGGL